MHVTQERIGYLLPGEMFLLEHYKLSDYSIGFPDTPVLTTSTILPMPLTPMSHVLNYELPITVVIIYCR